MAGMRIIAGAWRGRKLVAPAGATTRPTADRARETLFSMLASRLGGFTGLSVADLFAGSGALGLEALSRGAASCLFVDTDRDAIAAIRTNVASLAAKGAEIRQVSALTLAEQTKPFDLILLDPPYAQDGLDALLDQLVSRGWTAPGTMVSVETGHGYVPQCATLSHLVSRKVGKAELHLYRMD